MKIRIKRFRNRLLVFVFAIFSVEISYGVDFAPAATATNQLGVQLCQKVAAAEPHTNVLMSPYSLQISLALAYAGADGATRSEMGRVLHYPADDATLRESFKALRVAIDRVVHSSAKFGKDSVEWNVANGIFGERDYAFVRSYLELVKQESGASFEPLDFKQKATESRATINDWVRQRTKGKISALLSEGAIDSKTRLVLANAIYFRATWKNIFDEADTSLRPFHLPEGASVDVPTLRQTAEFGYAKQKEFTAVTLPYLGDELQLLILLPNASDAIDAWVSKLTPELLAECAHLRPSEINLYLPKLDLDGEPLSIGSILQSLGMKTAFDQPEGSANFTRMAAQKPNDYLALSDVFHQASFAMNEHRTEATAATDTVVLGEFGVSEHPRKPIEVHVDQPFLFTIQHRASGACLFLGRISDPR